MAKGQKRSNREIRKPKKSAAQRSTEAAALSVKDVAPVAAALKNKKR